MEQAERPGAPSESASRSQNIVYTAPSTLETLERALTPALERVDSANDALQVVIITPDAESALAAADVASEISDGDAEIVPVSAANRAARLIEGRTVHVVAGPAAELQTLVQRSTLKLDGVSALILLQADEIAESGADALAALEALFAEFPKTGARTLVTRRNTAEVEQLIERYVLKARRVGGEETESDAATAATLRYASVSSASRASTLQRLLDELDPPSSAIVAATPALQEAAEQAIRQLGYRKADDPIRVITGEIPSGTHTVIFFSAPTSAAEIEVAAEATPVQMVALTTPRELQALRDLVGTVAPITLSGASSRARQRDRALRDELVGLLAHGVASRELLALEPLLDQYDGIEIAAAAVRLLERERARIATMSSAPAAPAAGAPAFDRPRREFRESREPREFREPREDGFRKGGFNKGRPGGFGGPRKFDDRPKRDFGDRPKRDFGDRPKRDFGDRPKRDFSDRPKRDFSDRPKRDFGDRPNRDFGDRPKRDFGDRPKRDFGDRPRGGFDRGGFDRGRPPRDFKPRRKFD